MSKPWTGRILCDILQFESPDSNCARKKDQSFIKPYETRGPIRASPTLRN